MSKDRLLPSRVEHALEAGLVTVLLSACQGGLTPTQASDRKSFIPTPSQTAIFKPTPAPTLEITPTPTLETAVPTATPKETTFPVSLPAYFLDWQPSYATALKDAKGVVMQDYGGSLGEQYQPTTIAQAALAYYNRWLVDSDPTQAEADKTTFLTQVNWLISHQTPDGRWLFTFEWGSQPVPWWSAMTEGVAMSALLRAYGLTADPACLTAITRARTTFERDLDHNGVGAEVAVGSTTYVVYQEYLKGYESNVLNGWIFSLVGLYETAIYLPDSQAALDLWGADRGIAALKALLPYYDTGVWSRYDMTNPGKSARGDLDTIPYHDLITRQLKYIAMISGDPFFASYADRFHAEEVTCLANGGCPPAS